MEILLGIPSILLMGAIVGIPIRLIFRKWKDSTVAYITAGILGTVSVILGGPPPIPIFALRLLTVTIIVGTLFWGCLALFRRIFKIQPPIQQSKTTQDYIICPKCGLEQWNGYKNCQKCGSKLGKGTVS